MKIKASSRPGAFFLALYATTGLLGTSQAQTPPPDIPRNITCDATVCKYTDGTSLLAATAQSLRGARNLGTAQEMFRSVTNPIWTLQVYGSGTLKGGVGGQAKTNPNMTITTTFNENNGKVITTSGTTAVERYNQFNYQSAPLGTYNPKELEVP